MNGKGATAELATFAARTKYADLPDSVREIAQDLLVDTLGCAVAGHLVDKGSIPTGLVESWGGAQEASVIGSELRAPIPMVCLANGELMNALDFDAILAPGHVTPYVVPPAVAFAEHTDASGEALVAAVALAHELGARVGAALDGMREWDADGGTGSPLSPASGYGSVIFGAAAGAGCLVGMDADAMTNLLGIAGYAAPVPGLAKFVTAPHSFHVKYTSAGQLAMTAAMSVQLALRGYRGDPTVLEGDHGFWRMFASRKCDWDFMLDGLDAQWRIERTEIKPYPAFRMSHDALGVVRDLVREHAIDPATISRIVATADPLSISDCYLNVELTDHTDAQLSWRHLLAAAAYYERPTAWQIEAMDDERVRDLARRVEIVPMVGKAVAPQEASDGGEERAYPVWLKSSVDVFVGDTSYTAAAPPHTKGHPDNPMTRAEIDDKFVANVSVVLGEEAARTSLGCLRDPQSFSAREMVASLRPEPAARGR